MRKDQSYDHLIKLLIIGNSGVGKTNMLLRFCQNNFMTSHLTTIGIDFKIKTINIDNKRIRLQIWDTAGQQRFKTITQTYYRGAMGIIMTYAVNDRQSFEQVENWVKQIKMHASDNVVKILVGNKCDASNREVTFDQGKQLANQIGVNFFQTSAKEDKNIEQSFFFIAKEIKQQLNEQEKVGVVTYTGSKIHKAPTEKKKDGCC